MFPPARPPFVPQPSPFATHNRAPLYSGQFAVIGAQIRPIISTNFRAELDWIGRLLFQFPYIAVDAEYPGTVHRAAAGRRDHHLSPDERYAIIKANVDEVPIVQLGLTLFDENGRLHFVVDPATGCPLELSWEAHFSDFDVRRDRHAPESVAFLRSRGVDLDAARAHGVSAEAFGQKLAGVLPFRSALTWVTFGGAYDVAFLLKMLTGGMPLPGTRAGFMARVRAVLGGRVFDGKCMAERFGMTDLRGVGLKSVVDKLGVPPMVPEPPFLAGAKSLAACRVYARLTFAHPDGQDCEGLIDGLQ